MRMTFWRLPAAQACLPMSAWTAPAGSKRALDANDFDRLVSVEGVACSADGAWIAYTLEGSDLEADERKSSVWMTDFRGRHGPAADRGRESASNPKFSPDGRYVSFLSERKDDAKSQLYLLDRRGGEAQPLDAIGAMSATTPGRRTALGW